MIFEESFNDSFCEKLEVYLWGAFDHLKDKRIRMYLCDGIIRPFIDYELTKKSVNDKRKITASVWFLTEDSGVDERLDLVLHFGKYALRRYARGTSLEDCLPPYGPDHFHIDPDNMRIDLYLL